MGSVSSPRPRLVIAATVANRRVQSSVHTAVSDVRRWYIPIEMDLWEKWKMENGKSMDMSLNMNISVGDMLRAENVDIFKAMVELGGDPLAENWCGLTAYDYWHNTPEFKKFLEDYAARRFYSAVASCDVSEIKRLRKFVDDRVTAVSVYILLDHVDDDRLDQLFDSLGQVDYTLTLCEDQIAYLRGAYPLPADRCRPATTGNLSPQ